LLPPFSCFPGFLSENMKWIDKEARNLGKEEEGTGEAIGT
jgi:hypothetical protein